MKNTKFNPGDRVVCLATLTDDVSGYIAATVLEAQEFYDGMYTLEEDDGEIAEAYEEDMVLLSEFTGELTTMDALFDLAMAS